jgi:acetyl-CoA carboxylase biotin carboxyl carrier protein
MKELEIRQYAELMKELDLTGLEVSQGDWSLRLERGNAVSVVPSGTALSRAAEAPAYQPVPEPDCYEVKSPVVGVFYAAAAENAAPYVSIGDHVQKGQTLCVLEAMKLMNEIAAEEPGVVTEICVADGQVVEYGTVLFRIRR